jgi:phosphate transport system substrate-binding protein
MIMHELRVMAALATAVLLAAGCGGTQTTTVELVGEGATFPVPLYERWAAKAPFPEIRFEYRPSGSGAGIDAILAGKVDYAGSEAAVSDEQMQQHGTILHVPLTIAPIAVGYTLAAAPDGLKLTGELLADVFLGQIVRWDDRRIAQLNPGVALPPTQVVVVHRGDSSGTTKVFTEYLTATSPVWGGTVGTKTSVAWPVGLAGNGNTGVASIVRRTEGAIGYMSLSFARVNRLKAAQILNRANRYVAPNLDGATAAAAQAAAHPGTDLRISLVDQEGELSYPITGFSYMLVRADAADEQRARALQRLVVWMLHDGQAYAPGLGYATLPPEMVSKGVAEIGRVRHAGKPIGGERS